MNTDAEQCAAIDIISQAGSMWNAEEKDSDIKIQSESISQEVKENLINPQLTIVLAISLINPIIGIVSMKINTAFLKLCAFMQPVKH